MPDLTTEQAIEKLRGLPEERQRKILSALSPDQKKNILTKLRGSPGIDTLKANVAKYPKDTGATGVTADYRPEEQEANPILRYLSSLGGAVVSFPKNMLQTVTGPLTEEEKQEFKGHTRIPGEVTVERLTGAPLVRAAKIYADPNQRPTWEQAKSVLPEALGSATGGVVAGELTGTAIKGAKNLAKEPINRLKQSVAPSTVKVGNTEVPVLKSEAQPSSKGGRLVSEMKRIGAGEQRFKDFAAKQQAKVKEVIRDVAQKTSKMPGPMKAEPSEAMADASEATFKQARPMYDAMDQAVVNIPGAFDGVSEVMKQAIARARKLGVQIPEGVDSVYINGRKFTPQMDPVAWKKFQSDPVMWQKITAQGGVSAATPLSTFIKIRSQLLKMANGTSDAALANTLRNEASQMTANIETALQGTPLLDDFKEAGRLWSKGYALREVADGIRAATKGTPTGFQPGAIEKIETSLKGPNLVTRLNNLAASGDLAKAFTPEEAANLRQAASILERARPAGTEFGVGYTAHSTFWRNIQKIPARVLVKAMTTPEGVEALRTGNVYASPVLSAYSGYVAETKPKRKKPGEQIRDLQKLSTNPNLPVGTAP